MLITLMVQVLLPLAMIAALMFMPANSLAGYSMHAIGTGAVLLALKLAALWMILPWWLPLAYGLLWAFVIGATITHGRLLAHFRPGSVRVRTGERVTIGQPVGEVGNSGNTTEPHLHISAQLPGSANEPLSGEPLAIAIDGEYWVRNDRIYEYSL